MEEFSEVYTQYAGIVKRYLRKLGANDDLSDDLTAETFLRALRHADSYDGSVQMSTWLCTIAKRLYFNHRKRKSTADLPLTEAAAPRSASPSAQQTLEDAEGTRLLYRALLTLPPPQKDVVYLHTFAGLPFREIGALFSKSEGWARVTFFRAKQQLKELLQDE